MVRWIDADTSDFTDDAGKPAALYHVRYARGSLLDGDGEDLEEHEVIESHDSSGPRDRCVAVLDRDPI